MMKVSDQSKQDEEGNFGKRAPSVVMRLARMGSFHQSRLSFMRVLLRRLKQEQWTFDRPVWDIDKNGVGVATYRAVGPNRTYTLVAFGHDLPAHLRSDRVIAEAWDSTFALFDGEPEPEDIVRLAQNVPLQEAGRISERELVLSRANKSVRLFDYVKDCLSKGTQPEADRLLDVGYLMRTTAVYGSGKFGAADRDCWKDRPELVGSFQPELLSVWLIRAFTIDLVEHVARASGSADFVKLDPDLRRMLGVGNSTGLGMAPFLINHPALIHAWINARESALERVRSIANALPENADLFRELVARASRNADSWHSDHPIQKEKLAVLKQDLEKLAQHLETFDFSRRYGWNQIFEWSAKNLSLEGQEQCVSLLLEPHGELIDDLASSMQADEKKNFKIEGNMPVGELAGLIDAHYDWVSDVNFDEKPSIGRIWYVSEEKLEPRLGERFEEPLDAYEQPLAPGRDVARLKQALADWKDDTPIAEFLMKHPEHRHIVRRIQTVGHSPYGEIHDNTISAEMLPIDLLRCKLSFFGATKFDPRSDRWVRITMYQGAPMPDELAALDPDHLAYPE